ncbi:MAG TPA: hypothetical protein VHM19_10615 [Polyangiales bacterium]|nr:hypothetical protein [Polyangiales bacterium]
MEQFDVYIRSFKQEGEETPELGLVRVFRLHPVRAVEFVQSIPRVVKRRLPRDDAERYAETLRQIGAEVELRASPIAPQRVLVVGPADEERPPDPNESGRTLTLPPPASEAEQAAARPNAFSPRQSTAATMVAMVAPIAPPPSAAAKRAVSQPLAGPAQPPPQATVPLGTSGLPPALAPDAYSSAVARSSATAETQPGFVLPIPAAAPRLSNAQDLVPIPPPRLPADLAPYPSIDLAPLPRAPAHVASYDPPPPAVSERPGAGWLELDRSPARPISAPPPSAADGTASPSLRPSDRAPWVVEEPLFRKGEVEQKAVAPEERASQRPDERPLEIDNAALRPAAIQPAPLPNLQRNSAERVSAVGAIAAPVVAARRSLDPGNVAPRRTSMDPPAGARAQHPAMIGRRSSEPGRNTSGQPVAHAVGLDRMAAAKSQQTWDLPPEIHSAIRYSFRIGLGVLILLATSGVRSCAIGDVNKALAGWSSSPLPSSAPSVNAQDGNTRPGADGAAAWCTSDLHQFANGDKDVVRGLIQRLNASGAGVEVGGIVRSGPVSVATELHVSLPMDRERRHEIYETLRAFHTATFHIDPGSRDDGDPFGGKTTITVDLG